MMSKKRTVKTKKLLYIFEKPKKSNKNTNCDRYVKTGIFISIPIKKVRTAVTRKKVSFNNVFIVRAPHGNENLIIRCWHLFTQSFLLND